MTAVMAVAVAKSERARHPAIDNPETVTTAQEGVDHRIKTDGMMVVAAADRVGATVVRQLVGKEYLEAAGRHVGLRRVKLQERNKKNSGPNCRRCIIRAQKERNYHVSCTIVLCYRHSIIPYHNT